MMLIMEKEEESPVARLFIMIGPSSLSSSPRFCNHLQTLRLVCFLTTSSVSFCNQFGVQSRRAFGFRNFIGALQLAHCNWRIATPICHHCCFEFHAGHGQSVIGCLAHVRTHLPIVPIVHVTQLLAMFLPPMTRVSLSSM